MSDSVISQLCATCGLCCNGVLFHRVGLQPGDSAKELAALGLKLQSKKRQHSILQPCPAHRGHCCTIYENRPERCRLFVCRQLQGVIEGKISEAIALDKIHRAQLLVTRLRTLFEQAGAKNNKKSFITRYEAAIAQPLSLASTPAETALRTELIDTFTELETFLSSEFRIKSPNTHEHPPS